MKELKKKIPYTTFKYIFLILTFVVFYWFDFYSFIKKILIIVFLLGFQIITFDQIIFNEKRITILYPFFKLIKPKNIDWEQISKIVLTYRSGLTHGPMMPSSVEIHIIGQKPTKVYYHPTKEELSLLIEIVEGANKTLIIKNNPYIEYD